ncbi:MAG: hypothetical protein BWY70_00112 [Bacteroidetes bacterium ADurb.Bin408]|nr:MAG: hypothetical protein BWY70_00112 [Bacteroidetes bacterium ADurb.Bin408]
MENSLINIGLIVSYTLFGITLLAALILPLINFFKNFNLKKSKNSFIALAILIIIAIVSFAMSSGDAGSFTEDFGISSNLFKMIGGSLVTTYIMFFITIIVAVVSEATNRIK